MEEHVIEKLNESLENLYGNTRISATEKLALEIRILELETRLEANRQLGYIHKRLSDIHGMMARML